MQPIISPIFIYLIDTIDTIKGFSIFVLGISMIIVSLTMWGILFNDDEDWESEKVRKSVYKIKNTFLVLLIISFLIVTFVPSKTTMIQMYVADKITYDTVDKILKSGKNIKDELKKDIFDLIKEIKKDEGEKK